MGFYERYIHNWERRLTLRDTNRRIFRFDWGLDWLELEQEPEDPLSAFKSYARRGVEESESFYAPLLVRDFQREGDLLTFPTSTPTATEANNTVYSRLFPAREAGCAVIVIPQWNADARSHVALCRALQRFGITAARLTLPYHERRLPPSMRRADHMVSPNLGRTLHATRQAVLEVRQLAVWLTEQGHERIGVMGTSIGSCVGFLAFVHEPLLRTAVFNHVSSFFADVVWTGLATRYVRWGLEGNISLEDLRQCWAPISPWHFIPRLKEQQRPHLLITARYDLTFVPELSEEVFRQYHRHGIPFDHTALPCGHYTTARFPFKYLDGFHICRYLLRKLRPARPAP